MLDIIRQHWINWVCGLCTGGLVATFRHFHIKLKRANQRQDALEQGLQAMLRDRIVQAYYHYKERGNISQHGLESIESMYKAYHLLGGNGMVTHLMEDMRKLEIVSM